MHSRQVQVYVCKGKNISVFVPQCRKKCGTGIGLPMGKCLSNFPLCSAGSLRTQFNSSSQCNDADGENN